MGGVAGPTHDRRASVLDMLSPLTVATGATSARSGRCPPHANRSVMTAALTPIELRRQLAPAPLRGLSVPATSRDHRRGTVIAVIYLLAAAGLTWRLWTNPAGRAVAGNPHDTDLYTWWLAWAAHALTHGHLPLIVHAMNAPTGVNAMWNTSLLLPAIVLSPVTLTAGAQVSYNLLVLLGFAGSASTGYLLLRRHTTAAAWPATLGGALYGFSPAMRHAAIGHVSLLFAPLVPLLVATVLDLVRRRVTVLRGGVRLGVLAASQLLTGEELLYDTAVAVSLLLLVLVAARPRIAWRRMARLSAGLATASAVGALLAGYPLWIQLRGPLTQHGSPFAYDYFKADLAGFITPDRTMLFHSAPTAADHYGGGAPEYLAFLGWPLLVLVSVALVIGWRDLQLRATAMLTGVLAALSLGATVMVHGRNTHLPGPWRLLQHLPFATNALPTRFGLFVPLAAGATLAMILTQAQRYRSHIPAVAIAIAVVTPVLPHPLPTERVATTPTSTARVLATLPSGAAALIVPFPTGVMTEPMRWQAAADFRYRMPGGYFTGPAADGHAYIGGDATRPTETLLAGVDQTGHVPTITADQRGAAMNDLKYWHTNTVVLPPCEHHDALATTLTALFGVPTGTDGGTLVWQLGRESAS